MMISWIYAGGTWLGVPTAIWRSKCIMLTKSVTALVYMLVINTQQRNER
jgi:hypothetical protein